MQRTIEPVTFASYVPNPLFALLLFFIGAILAFPVCAFAAKRALRQPLLVPIKEEQALLAALIASAATQPPLSSAQGLTLAPPAGHLSTRMTALREKEWQVTFTKDHMEYTCYGQEGTLSPDAFVTPFHREVFLLCQLHYTSDDSPGDLWEEIKRTANQHNADGAFNELRAQAEEWSSGSDVNKKSLGEYALEITASHEDRTLYAGNLKVVPSATPNSVDKKALPVQRQSEKTSPLRLAKTALGLGFIFALFPAFIEQIRPPQPLSEIQLTLALVAFAAITIAGMIIALVDLDTMYVDIPAWSIGTLVGWGVASIVALSFGQPQRLLVALICVVVVVVFFEVANLLFKILRGKEGQGLGDTLIVVMTVGVPVALTGNMILALWIVIAAEMSAIVVAFIKMVFKGAKKETPLAFGPWLTAGWVIALCIMVADTYGQIIVRY